MRVSFLLAGLIGIAAAFPAMSVAPVPVPAQPTAPALSPENILDLDLSTGGRVRILLRPDKAPRAVERIRTLAARGFYNGLTFHRVIEGFMAQGGDPVGDGTGGSDLPDLKAEYNDLPHVRGTLSMARAQSPDSANSQFFIMLQPNLGLDGNYTAVGRVISGMEFVDALERGEPPEKPSKIVRAAFEGEPAAALNPVAAAVAEVAKEEPVAAKR